jgi:hypothetical protein
MRSAYPSRESPGTDSRAFDLESRFCARARPHPAKKVSPVKILASFVFRKHVAM